MQYKKTKQLESNKNKCYKQASQTKESQSIPNKKSKTFEVMEIWKCKFNKLKPTALSQKQTIFAGHNQR